MLKIAEAPLLTEEQIAERIEEMAGEIAADLGEDKTIMMVGLLRGCFAYFADLARALSRQNVTVEEVDFIVASSYGSGTESSRNVKIVLDLNRDIQGRKVLVVDDIFDTGNTMKRIRDLMMHRNPAWLKLTTILDKPERREVDMEVDYTGFKIPNHFVVGYGLDYDQRYRELPYISVMLEV